MRFKKNSLFLILITIVSACATYEPQYKNPEEKPSFPTDKKVERTFYLVGDAGISPLNRMSDGLTIFNNYLKKNPTKASDHAIFLGDNIYDDGMPAEGHPNREISEYYMDNQFKALEDFKGQTYIIPGNHEYYSGGLVGLKREQEYVQKHLDSLSFQPTGGCPLINFSVSENVELLMLIFTWSSQ